ncbi:transcription-repair coupling factor [Turneriella parva]|uniref:Transcription-repair-coupling factor n=1 Tax=Turneriella parva (strain ATCC BAA-1111 / DSM 21527 / NCTC 11395 / H) TaxID=869212 RepID=I4B8P8_TURPD|nr:transcription-repair coupling factor [Turneriella parva]AFM13655.1 transcription-repair coupling factor [Turneriella parva DSM 21527]
MAESALPKKLSAALQDLAAKTQAAANLPAGILPMLAFTRATTAPKPGRTLYIVPDDNTALEWLRALGSLHQLTLSQLETAALVSWGVIPYSFTAPDQEKEYHRTRAELFIRSEVPCLIVASVEGLTYPIATDLEVAEVERTLTPGMHFARSRFAEFLLSCGFRHANPVERPGEFCIKGGVVDVFAPDEDLPVRLDFFGDEIETIKSFSHETQRSLGPVAEVRIAPLRPAVSHLAAAMQKFAADRSLGESELTPVITSGGTNLAGYADIYPALRQVQNIAELWRGETFIADEESVRQRLKTISAERQYLFERSESKLKLAPEILFGDVARIEAMLSAAHAIQLTDPKDEDSQWHDAPRFGGRLGLLKERLAQGDAENIWFFIESISQRDRLKAALTDILAPEIIPAFYPHGFTGNGVTVFSEADIFGRVVKKYAGDKSISRILDSYTDLKEGDYVVHVNYGIGRFSALKRMRVQNNERDFIELRFADDDKLFVPLDQLNLVHKYIGSTENPRLDHLGKKSSWAKTRARVKRLVDSIAEELLELYAHRVNQKGFAFPPDSSFQHDFEAAFPFTETEHQLETIYAIKADMESEKPMDRLVCGDVGFGKTEVAIRAAFKAAMAGKQVAVLCPTTILAFQHYRSFSKRFADYPVRIDYISRFRSPSEVAEIKARLADGKIDIIIGTHALFADDVRYKSLGLMIIDEEQRFGVTHKEKLRQMRTNLDCLALTATPIPRTLHMSLSGIRDLSIIETPPADRRKIETHVIAENEELLRLAFKHELERGGQVYVLHNKVKTIEEQAIRLRALAPQARIAVLHGQMPETAIEEVMVDFYQHAYDILVSTTIIESGIDIPNCNTLIVLGAHEFGLSQLYQLKGRVGRSDRQAYAYFFYPSPTMHTLSGDAERRLEVLAEYDDLGSGFRIAMKDLEIRGAGNLLGKEQSGEIMEIGFELYSQMLNDKVNELKGKAVANDDFTSAIMLPCDWYFPDEYIADTRAKMEFYKSLSAAAGLDEFHEIREALVDRYGKPPETVELMLLLEEIRQLAYMLRLERVAISPKTDDLKTPSEMPYFIVAPDHRLDMAKVSALLTRDKRVKLDTADPKRINLDIPQQPQLAFFRELSAILKYLANS